jgi:hypothetical protein
MKNFAKQFIVDSNGHKIAVIIDWSDFKRLEEEIDELHCALAYKESKVIVDKEISEGDFLNLDDFIKSQGISDEL